MDILDDMGVSKLSAKVFLKVNYSLSICRKQCNHSAIKRFIPVCDLFIHLYIYILHIASQGFVNLKG